jgi:hypothetical protein
LADAGGAGCLAKWVVPKAKNPDSSPASKYLGEERPGLQLFLQHKSTEKMAIDKNYLKKVFSAERTSKYFNQHSGENQAIIHYYANIYLSESFYPILSIFEVALRNSLDRELTTLFGKQNWYDSFATIPDLSNLNGEISRAKNHILKRGETLTSHKIIAELTLGFWVRLLNTEYEMVLWRDLRRAFPFIPKIKRQRGNISAPLNKIRDFRNRVYHNEPVSWNLHYLENIRNEIYNVLFWLNKDLPNFTTPIDRSDKMIKQAKMELSIP